jgi:hypothetical protein
MLAMDSMLFSGLLSQCRRERANEIDPKPNLLLIKLIVKKLQWPLKNMSRFSISLFVHIV